MSRTKGSPAQAGPPHWRHGPEQDVNAHPHDPRGHARQPAPTGQYQSDPYAAQQAPAYQRPQPQPHFPHEAFRQLGGERHAAALSRPSHPPHFERAPAPHNSGSSLHERLGQHVAEAQHRNDGYGRGAPQAGWPKPGDPSGYDLAQYTPDQHAGARPGGVHDPYAAQGPYDTAAAEGWNGGGWNGHQQPYADPAMDGSYPGQQHGYGGEHQPGGPDDQEYAYDEEAEAPRRGPRVYMIAGALVGAIAVGGALAYGYKSFGGRGDGKTPVVRADGGPAKTRPTEPGGKDIAHTDKKFINRLGDDKAGAGSETGTLGDADAGGPRKVTTLTVNRDGSMAAPNPVSQNSGSGFGGSGVPGMLVEGLNSGPARPQLRGSATADAQASSQQGGAQPVQQAAPQRPQVIAKATAAPEPAPRPAKKQVEREEASEAPAKSAVASAAPVQPASTGGNGYVPVLSSQKSRMDALKAFADMQQKYSDALQNGTPDVREVNLGEKGVWHRLMLGPPGSRESAKTVCTQLKAQGYSGCWVTAY